MLRIVGDKRYFHEMPFKGTRVDLQKVNPICGIEVYFFVFATCIPRPVQIQFRLFCPVNRALRVVVGTEIAKLAGDFFEKIDL